MTDANDTRSKIQVKHDYYRQPKYSTVERFISYQHQIVTLRDAGVKNILLVGPGDGLVPYYLKEVLGINVTICDIDPDLKPDIVADVRNMPCEDESFDAVAVFEVLEHLPFEDFPVALKELSRISKGKVFISLPYRNVAFEVLIKFPYIRTLLKRPWIHFIIKKPIKFLGFEFSQQHYWEIDTVTTKKVVEGVVSKFFNITKRRHVVFDPYRYFIDLEKKPNVENEFAEEYYNDFLRNNPEDYKTARWFSSKPREFDYHQTKKVIERALRGVQARQTLEIGPGDAVWTDLIIPHTEKITLLDQSEEMLKRAKKRFPENNKISYVHSDIERFSSDAKFDLICGIRCFEYFEDKPAVVKKFYDLLNDGGKLVIVTKNPEHSRTKETQKKDLHKGQISKEEMISLLKQTGFKVETNLSAVSRIKTKYALGRTVSKLLHNIHVATNGVITLPFINNAFTESYIYVARKK